MKGRPQPDEAAPYYFTYINQAAGDNPLRIIETQFDKVQPFLTRISEEKSKHRYAPDKWTIRQVLNHVTDTERAFVFRAVWFARGFDAPLPGYDQNIASAAAEADAVPWSAHVEEFKRVRLSTISFFRNLPANAWMRKGIASDNPFTVRALGFIIPGHVAHHLKILQEKYF
jgi:hypothetical protein